MKAIPFVIRAGGQYWGTNPVTGRPGWTWAPAGAQRFASIEDAHNVMLATVVEVGTVVTAQLKPGPEIEFDERPAIEVKSPEYEVVPDPTGSKW